MKIYPEMRKRAQDDFFKYDAINFLKAGEISVNEFCYAFQRTNHLIFFSALCVITLISFHYREGDVNISDM